MSSSTKTALSEALIELLRDRTLDHITVKDIADYCKVNRQTFYYHFKDVYDLLEWIFHQRLEKTSIDMFSLEEWYEGFVFFFNTFLEDRYVLLNAYRSIDKEEIHSYLYGITYKLIEDYANKHYSHIAIKKSDFDFVIRFYTLMFIAVVKDWFDQGMPESYEHVIDQFYQLVKGSMDFAFKQFNK